MSQTTTKDDCVTRWILLVQEYKIILFWLTRKQNIFSDASSRLVDIRNNCEDLPVQLDEKLLNKISMLNDSGKDLNETKTDGMLQSFIPLRSPWTEEELLNAQNNDNVCKEIRATIRKGTTEKTSKLAYFRALKNILFVHRTIKRSNVEGEYLDPYVPKSLMNKTYKLVHEDMTARQRF